MSILSELLTSVFQRYAKGDPAAAQTDRTMSVLVAGMLSQCSEINGMVTAREILDRFSVMRDDEKRVFFGYLADALDVDADAMAKAVAAFGNRPDVESYGALQIAAEPPRQELVRRLNQSPGATQALVGMRADLLRLVRRDDPVARIDLDFRHLFASWFNRGFLVLRPVNWDSSARLLEKIIAYEAVHQIRSWDDLRRRIQPEDRRCFGFFHPSMPEEPLIFVEVALTTGTPGNIQALLAEDRAPVAAQDANTAVFYSISNCQAGLAGVSFGNFLIKQVTADLAAELPNLKTFLTLSPVPKLGAWIRQNGLRDARGEELRQAAAAYLIGSKLPCGLPSDPVARFHLSNGAELHAIHLDADLSEKGREQSFGVMVNYLYDRARIAVNHERFANNGTVAAAPTVVALAEKAQPKEICVAQSAP